MLRSLRIKLTFINMSLVSAVLIAVLAVLLIISYRQGIEKTREALAMALLKEEAPPFTPENETAVLHQAGRFQIGQDRTRPGFMNEGKEAYVPTAVVVTNESGENFALDPFSTATLSEETLQQAVTLAIAKEAREGHLPQYGLRFLMEPGPSGTLRIAFADTSEEESRFHSLLFICIVGGLVALIALFLISLGLSSLALRPVQTAMNQQRQFVADASHELKTPLTVMLTNNEILLRHPAETVASQGKWLESSQAEGERMKKLIENLLFLAKSDADRLPFHEVRANISDLLQNCLLTFEPVAFERSVEIISSIEEDLFAKADETQLKQLFLILLDNAVKYSPRGEKVHVRLQKSGSSLHLTVKNQGDPISPEDLPHLFERFYRADASRAREEDGSSGYGLGLSIAKTIADLHHASLSVKSSAQDGTVFTLSLPEK